MSNIYNFLNGREIVEIVRLKSYRRCVFIYQVHGLSIHLIVRKDNPGLSFDANGRDVRRVRRNPKIYE